jgi:hypothetical protein
LKFRDDVTNINIIDHRTENDDLVGACAIQKGAEGYLDEWVNYYFGLGVSRIFIYDNSENFDLEGWSKQNVEVYHLPGTSQQMPAYNLCIQRIREYNKKNLLSNTATTATEKPIQWAIMFDVDEFLVMRRQKTIGALVRNYCPVEEGCGGLVVNWYLFYFANETAYRPIPMTKRFPYREQELNQHVKSIVHVDSFDASATHPNPHCFKYLNNRTSYDTKGVASSCPFILEGRTDSVAAIHHIWTKSRAEFLYRCIRGDADMKEPRCIELPKDPPNLVYDDSAWQVLKENVPAYKWYDEDGVGLA